VEELKATLENYEIDALTSDTKKGKASLTALKVEAE